MYEITTETSFSAAHHLRDYNGPCEKVHGHNWLVKTTVRCKELNEIGIGIDFRDLKKAVKKVIDELDHSDLNVIFNSQKKNPSSENIARYIYEKLNDQLSDSSCHAYKIEVFETPGNSAAYIEDKHA